MLLFPSGKMDATAMRCLVNSISRFIHFVSCQRSTVTPIGKDFRNMVVVVKLLKPLLDEVVDYKLPSDEMLCKVCEELDVVVNEAREFMESWSSKGSKICSALQSESYLMQLQSYSLQICHILETLSESSTSTSTITSVQKCMREIQCLRQERISDHMEVILKSLRDDAFPCADRLKRVIELLGLISSQDIFKESVAVANEGVNSKVNQVNWKLDQAKKALELISCIREFILTAENFEAPIGVLVPSYFRCPLSLELMSDPVIVSSGQTYDRSSIQRWLDYDLKICPKTGQSLSHTNLIPNYTVKAMISSWCQENKRQLINNLKQTNLVSVSTNSDCISSSDLIRSDSFRCSLHSCGSTSGSSIEVGNVLEKQKDDASCRSSMGGMSHNGEIQKYDHPSSEQSYVHSRTGSASSAISSIDYLPPVLIERSRSSKQENGNKLSAEILSDDLAKSLTIKESGPPWLTKKQSPISRNNVEVAENGNEIHSRTQSLSLSDLGCDDTTTASHVKKLVEDLKSQCNEVQTMAAAELRLLAKHNMDNRIIIGHCGAIAPLVSLLYSPVKLTQEHAVTALLNLSINEENRARMAEVEAIEPLIHVLMSGNDGAKENSAAALFSLSALEGYKAKVGRSGAVKALVHLLGSGTLRGKKDAAAALFSLSIVHENKARIVQAGAVRYLIGLMDSNSGMTDKAIALLSNLSTIGEGRMAITREGGVPVVVEVLESGSQRGKENAASILLQLCLNSSKFCALVLQEGAVPPLVALSQCGTPRAKEKAQQLLSHFRNQREVAMGRGKK